MLAPDVDIQDGKGTILISSEEGETDGKWMDITACVIIAYCGFRKSVKVFSRVWHKGWE